MKSADRLIQKILAGLALLAVIAIFVFGMYLWMHGGRGHPETEAYSAREDDPVKLIGEFRSYASVESATTRITQSGHAWRATQRQWPLNPDYPNRSSTTVRAPDFQACGSEGHLSLLFFNDRLYEAQFVPDDPHACLRHLQQQYPRMRQVKNGRGEWIDGHLRVATDLRFSQSEVGQALAVEPYVLWQDWRLREQLDDWDARFGGIPAQPEVRELRGPSED